MNIRDRADIEKAIEGRTSIEDSAWRLRMLLELDRIGNALETLINLVDGGERPPQDIEEVRPR